jgi:hypothetical protein
MSETNQAEILAQWLQATPGTVPPEELDMEVLGSVYALAPDRAPPHRVQLNDVLGSLLSGPVADPDVAAAAIALDPRRAGEHRVDIEQILESVTEGPFAQAESGTVVDLAAARKSRKRWIGVGAFAAAAAALFVVLPISDRATETPHNSAAVERVDESASARRPKKDARRAKRASRPTPKPESTPKTSGRTSENKKRSRTAAPEAAPAAAAYPPSMDTRGRREADNAASPAPQAPPLPEQDMEAELIEDSIGAAAEPQATPLSSKKSARLSTPPRGSERTDRGLGSPDPKGAWDGYPDTDAFTQKVLSAHRLARTDPERALKQIRRALKRYKRVDPSQRSLALKKEAAILEQLGRPAEAAEALKKSHAIQPAD